MAKYNQHTGQRHGMGWVQHQGSTTSHAEKSQQVPTCSDPLLMPKLLIQTVLTSLEYLQKSLTDMGMTYVHISVDLQLYIVACQIK